MKLSSPITWAQRSPTNIMSGFGWHGRFVLQCLLMLSAGSLLNIPGSMRVVQVRAAAEHTEDVAAQGKTVKDPEPPPEAENHSGTVTDDDGSDSHVPLKKPFEQKNKVPPERPSDVAHAKVGHGEEKADEEDHGRASARSKKKHGAEVSSAETGARGTDHGDAEEDEDDAEEGNKADEDHDQSDADSDGAVSDDEGPLAKEGGPATRTKKQKLRKNNKKKDEKRKSTADDDDEDDSDFEKETDDDSDTGDDDDDTSTAASDNEERTDGADADVPAKKTKKRHLKKSEKHKKQKQGTRNRKKATEHAEDDDGSAADGDEPQGDDNGDDDDDTDEEKFYDAEPGDENESDGSSSSDDADTDSSTDDDDGFLKPHKKSNKRPGKKQKRNAATEDKADEHAAPPSAARKLPIKKKVADPPTRPKKDPLPALEWKENPLASHWPMWNSLKGTKHSETFVKGACLAASDDYQTLKWQNNYPGKGETYAWEADKLPSPDAEGCSKACGPDYAKALGMTGPTRFFFFSSSNKGRCYCTDECDSVNLHPKGFVAANPSKYPYKGFVAGHAHPSEQGMFGSSAPAPKKKPTIKSELGDGQPALAPVQITLATGELALPTLGDCVRISSEGLSMPQQFFTTDYVEKNSGEFSMTTARVRKIKEGDQAHVPDLPQADPRTSRVLHMSAAKMLEFKMMEDVTSAVKLITGSLSGGVNTAAASFAMEGSLALGSQESKNTISFVFKLTDVVSQKQFTPSNWTAEHVVGKDSLCTHYVSGVSMGALATGIASISKTTASNSMDVQGSLDIGVKLFSGHLQAKVTNKKTSEQSSIKVKMFTRGGFQHSHPFFLSDSKALADALQDLQETSEIVRPLSGVPIAYTLTPLVATRAQVAGETKVEKDPESGELRRVPKDPAKYVNIPVYTMGMMTLGENLQTDLLQVGEFIQFMETQVTTDNEEGAYVSPDGLPTTMCSDKCAPNDSTCAGTCDRFMEKDKNNGLTMHSVAEQKQFVRLLIQKLINEAQRKKDDLIAMLELMYSDYETAKQRYDDNKNEIRRYSRKSGSWSRIMLTPTDPATGAPKAGEPMQPVGKTLMDLMMKNMNLIPANVNLERKIHQILDELVNGTCDPGQLFFECDPAKWGLIAMEQQQSSNSYFAKTDQFAPVRENLKQAVTHFSDLLHGLSSMSVSDLQTLVEHSMDTVKTWQQDMVKNCISNDGDKKAYKNDCEAVLKTGDSVRPAHWPEVAQNALTALSQALYQTLK